MLFICREGDCYKSHAKDLPWCAWDDFEAHAAEAHDGCELVQYLAIAKTESGKVRTTPGWLTGWKVKPDA